MQPRFTYFTAWLEANQVNDFAALHGGVNVQSQPRGELGSSSSIWLCEWLGGLYGVWNLRVHMCVCSGTCHGVRCFPIWA